MNYRCYQITLRVKYFCTNREQCEGLTGYLSLKPGLAVTGRVSDIGQKVLLSSFLTGSNDNPSYFRIFFLMTFLEEAIARNIVIILSISYLTQLYYVIVIIMQ